jgi:hypothetical protein
VQVGAWLRLLALLPAARSEGAVAAHVLVAVHAVISVVFWLRQRDPPAALAPEPTSTSGTSSSAAVTATPPKRS